MPAIAWSIFGLGTLVAWAFVCRALFDNSRGDGWFGLAVRVVPVYARIVHRLTIEGREHIPREREPGPLIIVANHTAGVDPILVQAACEFEIRWMMAKDMMVQKGAFLWEWARVIEVDRVGRDTTSAKKAIAHVREGGVLGIFPEGKIERPARTLMPFRAGVGLIIARTGARVLPVVIDGTPQAPHAWQSLVRTSRASVTFKPVLSYDGRGMDAGEIAKELEEKFKGWTGWGVANA